MTSSEVDRITTPNQVERAVDISQATAVEQERAIAEVKAAVSAAKQLPRDMDKAIRDMQFITDRPDLAGRAFFKYRRGGSAITGASIHLARELARVWGNVKYGIVELRRDPGAGRSEMKAYAWDLETNTYSETVFFVPHARDQGGAIQDLTALRDVYENNANMGARRVREMIFAVLPSWFTQEAQDRCWTTIEKGDGTELSERIDKAVALFAVMGVTRERLEDHVGQPVHKWTEPDVARLSVTYQSLHRNEVALDEVFPNVAQDAAGDTTAAVLAAAERPEAGGQPDAAEATVSGTDSESGAGTQPASVPDSDQSDVGAGGDPAEQASAPSEVPAPASQTDAGAAASGVGEEGEDATSTPASSPDPEPEPVPARAGGGRARLHMLTGVLAAIGLDGPENRDKRIAVIEAIVGHPVDDTAALAVHEVDRCIQVVSSCEDLPALYMRIGEETPES